MSTVEYISSTIKNVDFGERVKVVEPCNLYGCVLADDVFVGPFVEIQSDVVIGARTKVQSHSFICSLVKPIELLCKSVANNNKSLNFVDIKTSLIVT